VGLFNRSVMLLEKGIKPCWVFDGKPPEAKKKLLGERKKRKEAADEKLSEALDKGDTENALKYAGMSVRVTPQMTADAKRLIQCLGLPVIEAPSEAEAQCSVLAKAGKVYAVATEDMDCLTFGCPILLRDFSKKDDPVIEISLDKVLSGLGLDMQQFIDVCILCGCDYSGTIEGIGPVKALKLILEHKNIEGVIKHVEEAQKKGKTKYRIDEESLNYIEARTLFEKPETLDPDTVELKFTTPNYEEMKKFLVEERGFALQKIESAIKRIDVLNLFNLFSLLNRRPIKEGLIISSKQSLQ
jgi:flap endonuclease-1